MCWICNISWKVLYSSEGARGGTHCSPTAESRPSDWHYLNMTSTDNSLAHVLKRKSKLPKLNISLVILCHNVWDVFGCCRRQMVCFVRFFLLLPNTGIVSLSCTFLVWMEGLFEFLHNSYTLSWLSLTHFLPLSNLSTILELTPETH